MQANYFMGYALWNYLTTPYLLSHPGVETTELEPWHDGQAAHCVDDYVDVDGPKFPTRRWVYPRQPDNTPHRQTFTGSHGSLIDVAIGDIVLHK